MRIYGTNNADILFGTNDPVDYIYGYEGNDYINGAGGVDYIYAGSGDDFVEGGAGADVMNGGDGIDTLGYQSSNAGVYVELKYGFGLYGHAEGDRFSGFENVTGSNYADQLYGSDLSNVIKGLNGNDALFGRGGDDRLYGGSGNDELDGGSGNDSLYGDAGDDYLVGGAGADYLDGGAGNNTASYGGSDAGVTINLMYGYGFGGHATGDTLSYIQNVKGSYYGDHLLGNNDDNFLDGSSGRDDLVGYGGNDILYGGAGRDKLIGGTGADELFGNGSPYGNPAYNDGEEDIFYFDSQDTGSYYAGEADVIHDFEDVDVIQLHDVRFYTVWYNNDAEGWLVSWNDGSWHNIVVHGDDPSDNIVIV